MKLLAVADLTCVVNNSNMAWYVCNCTMLCAWVQSSIMMCDMHIVQ